jgi:hypothetical protein
MLTASSRQPLAEKRAIFMQCILESVQATASTCIAEFSSIGDLSRSPTGDSHELVVLILKIYSDATRATIVKR